MAGLEFLLAALAFVLDKSTPSLWDHFFGDDDESWAAEVAERLADVTSLQITADEKEAVARWLSNRDVVAALVTADLSGPDIAARVSEVLAFELGEPSPEIKERAAKIALSTFQKLIELVPPEMAATLALRDPLRDLALDARATKEQVALIYDLVATPSVLASASLPRRLIDETAFAGYSQSWPGDVANPSWVLKTWRRVMAAPVKADPERVKQAIDEAARIAESEDGGRGVFGTVRRMMAVLLDTLPQIDTYLDSVRDVPQESRVDFACSGYYRMQTLPDDEWAYCYLVVLRETGDHDALLPILAERFKKLHGARLVSTTRAWEATEHLARTVLHDDFDRWYAENVPDEGDDQRYDPMTS